MRFKILALAFGCLWIGPSAALSFELGPQLGMSVPTGRAGDAYNLGINAGVTATIVGDSTHSIGVDVGYQRWPGSPSLNATTDALLSRLSGSPISGSKWTLSALQFTCHVKLVARMNGPVTPWIQVGAGIYRVNDNLKLRGRYMDNIKPEVGYLGGVGLDFETSSGMKLGLNSSYQVLQSKPDFEANFTTLTIGAYLLVGR